MSLASTKELLMTHFAYAKGGNGQKAGNPMVLGNKKPITQMFSIHHSEHRVLTFRTNKFLQRINSKKKMILISHITL